MAVEETYSEDGKVGIFYNRTSFREALDVARVHAEKGFVASLPYLALQRVNQPKTHWVWQKGYDCAGTEEDVFVDEQGEFASKKLPRNEPLVAIIHGKGLAFENAENNCGFSVNNQEVIKHIKEYCTDRIYIIDDLIADIPQLQFLFVILATKKRFEQQPSGQHSRTAWTNNELVIARSLLTKQQRETYFDNASSNYRLGNWYLFITGKGRVPYFSDYYDDGFIGSDGIDNFARLVGVAPEAPQRALEWIARQQKTPEIELPRWPPIFVSGEGYFAPENVPKKEPQRQGQKEYEAIKAKVKQEHPDYTETQIEARADVITRFKLLELD